MALAALTAIGALQPLAPRPTGQSQRRNEPRIQVGVNMVLVDATVHDANGKPLDGLTKDSFTLRDNGVPQKIEYFGRDELPLNIVLVLDLSGSLDKHLESLRSAAVSALDSFKPEDQVAIFTFASEVYLQLQLTRERAKLIDALDSVKARGSTNIKDALFEAARYLLVVKPKGRRAIILISDDIDTDEGSHSDHDIVSEILEADASLYNLKVPGDNPHNFRSNLNVADVAKDTGGEIVEAKDADQFEPEFRALVQKIRTRYTLGYYIAPDRTDNKEHKLDVSLVPVFGRRGVNYSIVSKRGYFFVLGESSVEGYRQIGHQDTWTGEVASTDDSSRTITLTCLSHGKTESFSGTLPEGYKVRMSNGAIQELKPSQLPAGMRLTVYYISRTEKYFGKEWPSNQIFWIDFLK